MRQSSKWIVGIVASHGLIFSTPVFAGKEGDEKGKGLTHWRKPAMRGFTNIGKKNFYCLQGCVNLMKGGGAGNYGLGPVIGFFGLPFALAADAVTTPFTATGTVVAGVAVAGAAAVDGVTFVASKGIDRISHAMDSYKATPEVEEEILRALEDFSTRLAHARPFLGDREITIEQLYMVALAGTVFASKDTDAGLVLTDGSVLQLSNLPEDHPARPLITTLQTIAHSPILKEFHDRFAFLRAIVEAQFEAENAVTPLLGSLKEAAQYAISSIPTDQESPSQDEL